MGTRHAPNERLIEVAQRLVERMPDQDLLAALLFGSAAWGDDDAASDIDVMLLLDRPEGYREVSRVRLADLFGEPMPDGPIFADVDRYAWSTFEQAMGHGHWHARIVGSVILYDDDGRLERVREMALAHHARPAARATRFENAREEAELFREAAVEAEDAGDDVLAGLAARLAVEAAAGALVLLADGRVSSHLVDSTALALTNLGRGDLFPFFLESMVLADASPATVERSVDAFRVLAEALRSWMAEPAIAEHVTPEDAAWAVFTYGPDMFEHIDAKVHALASRNRYPQLQYVLDVLHKTPMRLNLGKLLLLRTTGVTGRMSILDYHAALGAYPALFAAWTAAMRLGPNPDETTTALALAAELLAAGEHQI